MIPIIYYAHSMKIYNTEREQAELRMLEEYFYNGLIFNPNRPNIQYSKNPMGECFKAVKDHVITGLAFSHDNGHIPSGVFAEIRLAQKRRKYLYQIDSDRVRPYKGTVTLTKKDRATDWARV